MTYNNNQMGQEDGTVTYLTASPDFGMNEWIACDNVKEFAAAVGVSTARIYEILREAKYSHAYIASQRLKNGWFVQVCDKKHAQHLWGA